MHAAHSNTVTLGTSLLDQVMSPQGSAWDRGYILCSFRSLVALLLLPPQKLLHAHVCTTLRPDAHSHQNAPSHFSRRL